MVTRRPCELPVRDPRLVLLLLRLPRAIPIPEHYPFITGALGLYQAFAPLFPWNARIVHGTRPENRRLAIRDEVIALPADAVRGGRLGWEHGIVGRAVGAEG
jgi:hypothetical protein